MESEQNKLKTEDLVVVFIEHSEIIDLDAKYTQYQKSTSKL